MGCTRINIRSKREQELHRVAITISVAITLAVSLTLAVTMKTFYFLAAAFPIIFISYFLKGICVSVALQTPCCKNYRNEIQRERQQQIKDKNQKYRHNANGQKIKKQSVNILTEAEELV